MTFVELMAGATKSQRTKITILVLGDGLSYSAFSSWCKGKRNPQPYYQTVLQKSIKRIFDKDLTIEELFPKK